MSVVKLHVFRLVCGVLWVQLGSRYTNFDTIFERLLDYKRNRVFFQQDSESAHTVKILRVFQYICYFTEWYDLIH
jgi:hypothetical protein